MHTTFASPFHAPVTRQELISTVAAITGTHLLDGISSVPSSSPPIDSRQARILYVAADLGTRASFVGALTQAGFEKSSGCKETAQALLVMAEERFDAVLLDLSMPEQCAFELIRQINRSRGPLSLPVPVLAVAAASDGDLLQSAMELGVTDFLFKPIPHNELKLRLHHLLRRYSTQRQINSRSHELAEQVERRTAELVASQLQLIHCLGHAARLRDIETSRHVFRVGRLSRIIAEELGMGAVASQQIELAATLHDIGKLAIPDSLLLKPGSLTSDEFAIMKQHALLGHDILNSQASIISVEVGDGSDQQRRSTGLYEAPLLKLAASIAATHHEHWNGMGYPRKLRGDQIPLAGRIVAVADVFDALSTDRPYKAALPMEHALSLIEQGREKQFDPEVVDAFQCRKADVERLYRHCDAAENPQIR